MITGLWQTVAFNGQQASNASMIRALPTMMGSAIGMAPVDRVRQIVVIVAAAVFRGGTDEALRVPRNRLS
jgi:hypothetical protein